MRRMGLFVAVVLASLPSLAWANRAPIADAGADQSIYWGDVATLSGSGMDFDGDPIAGWWWTMQSKPAGSLAQLNAVDEPGPYFIPDLVGDYVLTLMVSDGTLWSLPATVIIHVAENLPPTAVIVVSTTTGVAPLVVSFDASPSADPEGRPLTYRWTFGDGTLSTATTTSHEFSSVGTFQVVLRVTDDRGQIDLDSILIEVTAPNNPPVASPTATPATGAAPLVVQFAANSFDPDGDTLSYAWDFGDGGTSGFADPSHTYSSAGTYVAWLTVSDGRLEAAASLTIVVAPSLYLSVESAKIKWTKNKSTIGNVEVEAYTTAGMPSPDDMIAMYIDGIELFAAPFSSFRLEDDDDDGDDTEYEFKAKNLLVELDPTTGEIEVKRHKVDLAGLDSTNGVQIELHRGSLVAVQTITMTEEPGRQLKYER